MSFRNMESSMPDAFPKKIEVDFDKEDTLIIDSPEAARAFLRYGPLLWQASWSQPTIAEMAKMRELKLETVSYQVRRLVETGLLMPLGERGRGQRYRAWPRYVVNHEHLPQGALPEFLLAHSGPRLSDIFHGFQKHLDAGGSKWWIDVDFRRLDYLRLGSSGGEEPFPPLFTGFGFNLSEQRAAALYAELVGVYERYLRPEPRDAEGRRYYLMMTFGRSVVE